MANSQELELNSIQRILKALNYPSRQTFLINDISELAKATAWLEDRKIRFYDLDKRQPLRSATEGWAEAFQKYLEDLECPFTWSEDIPSRIKCFRWLLNRSVAYEYEDKGSTYNARAAQVAKQRSEESKNEAAGANISSDQDPLAVIHELCNRLGVKPCENVVETLKVVHLAVRAKYGSLDEMIRNQKGKLHRPQMDKFPLGFTTEDPLLDQAAKLLKMLYLTDLRHLQNSVNTILVTAQEFTANPKTNTALGKVGR
mmetsp:Transcript_4638/g.6380  ORF Transcript_4638/g.6380 Transcript_4638/m.6380 type:complete len:257 (-) Transcript_4638:219-989(-)